MPSFSRRNLFTSVAGALSLKGADAPKGQHSLETIGVQLYTVRDALSKDPEPVLKKIDQIGYREAEIVGASLEKIWPYLKQTRLKPVSIHLDSALFKTENSAKLSATFEDVKGRGFEYAVYPYLPPPERGGLDKIRALAETLNRAGAECRKAGLKLCYHNHAFEFQPMESTTPFDVLLTETDRDLVGLEMDIFWVSVGGHDPIELLKKYAGRVPLLHVKNKANGVAVQYNESVPKSAFKEAPNGVLDIAGILRAARDSGVQHYFVEQDATPGDPVESLRQSYDYLHRLKF